MTKKTLSKFAAALLGATCACDIPPPSTADANAVPSFRSVNTPGKAWGPCSADCEAGTTCMKTEFGSVCAPACGATACTAVQTDICGNIVGDGNAECLGPDCIRPCVADTECSIGMVCAIGDGYCVNPGE